jgi:hypothetical protein
MLNLDGCFTWNNEGAMWRSTLYYQFHVERIVGVELFSGHVSGRFHVNND